MIHEPPSSPPSETDDRFPFLRGLGEVDERPDSNHHGRHIVAGVCLLLAAAIGALIWYQYPAIVSHKADLIRLPGLAQNVDLITNHLHQTDAQIADWSQRQNIDREALQIQMTRLGREMRSGILTARKEAADAATAAYTRLETRVSEQIDGIETRLGGLETGREADQKRIAGLQQQVASLQEDLSRQSAKISSLESHVVQNAASVGSQIEGIQQEQARDRNDVGAIETQLAVDKVRFEALKGHDRELADGFALHVTKTDAARGRFDGWIALKPGARSIQLRHQSVQEPLALYGADGRKRELVITSVGRNSVTGYLAVSHPAPAEPSTSGPAY